MMLLTKWFFKGVSSCVIVIIISEGFSMLKSLLNLLLLSQLLQILTMILLSNFKVLNKLIYLNSLQFHQFNIVKQVYYHLLLALAFFHFLIIIFHLLVHIPDFN